MYYYGGKARNGAKIAATIAQYRKPDQPYLEPFCGSLSVTQYVCGDRTCSDINPHLITLFTAMQNGWLPPSHVSKEDYKRLQKTQDVNDPLTAYAGIIYSFGGAWFNGYKTAYLKQCHPRTLIKKMNVCQNVKFNYCDYDAYTPSDMIIYCDPPYQGTNGYHFDGGFNHDKFWDVMRQWSKTNTVIISEYNAPSDFKCIKKFNTWMSMKAKPDDVKRTDCLWTMNEPPKDEWFIWPD